MSIITPPRIEPGMDLREFLERLLQYVKSITPMSSDTIRVEHTSEGVMLHLDKENSYQGAGLLEEVGGVVIRPKDGEEGEEEEEGADV